MTLGEIVDWLRERPVFVQDGNLVCRFALTDQQRQTLKLYKPEILRELSRPYAGSVRYLYTRDDESGGVVRVIHHHRDMDYLRRLLGGNVHVKPAPADDTLRNKRNLRNDSNHAA